VVAINGTGQCMPPCGRCREMLYQINHANLDAEILLEGGKVLRLGDLLPERWQELYE
jgi:cytidine deaminase